MNPGPLSKYLMLNWTRSLNELFNCSKNCNSNTKFIPCLKTTMHLHKARKRMNYDVAPALAAAVAQAAMDSDVARLRVDPQHVAEHCHDFVYEGLLTPVPPLEELRA